MTVRILSTFAAALVMFSGVAFAASPDDGDPTSGSSGAPHSAAGSIAASHGSTRNGGTASGDAGDTGAGPASSGGLRNVAVSAGGNGGTGGGTGDGAIVTPTATPTTSQAALPGQVVAAGTVPDDATKAAILARLRDVYGQGNVVDHVEVGDVAVPANWSANVQKLLNADLKQVTKGQLKIDGTQIDVRGEVQNEAQRQQIASNMSTSLNPTYTIKNGLRVTASAQGVLDQTLANRTIEFETGSATLAPKGRLILDQMANVLQNLNSKTVAIIGHTDNAGSRQSNLALSQARADTVKGYLVAKGIPPQSLTASGVGPDQPVASNDTDEGRARNRRIEFRAGQ
jgi:OOP family OmpA-OmpF porin